MNGGQWYCMVNGERNGPYSVDQFRGMAAASPPPRDMPVWTEGMADWQPLASTPLAASLGWAMAPPPMSAGAPGDMTAMAQASGGTSIGFREAIRRAFARFTDFNSRATRPEFWYVWLFSMLLQLVLGVLDGLFGAAGAALYWLAVLILFLPLLAVAVRRLHDTDRSGWWYLLILVPLVGFIVLIVFWSQRGTPGRNRFG